MLFSSTKMFYQWFDPFIFKMPTILSDQLWKLNNENTLESKAGSWNHKDRKLSIPSEGRSDFITDIDSNKVLGKKKLNGKWLDELKFGAEYVPRLNGEIKVLNLITKTSQ